MTEPRQAWLEHVSCNLCGADDPEEIYPSTRTGSEAVNADAIRSSGDEPLRDRLVRCRKCDLVYVTPRVKADVMLAGYTDAVDENFVSQAQGRELTFQSCLDTIMRDWKAAPGRLLDVGTANGSFLKVARDAGWTVAGCEPSRWMCEWARTHYGLEVANGSIFTAAYPAASFDVVTLWDVLEHTPDPLATLREAVRVLRPGGLLVVNYPDYGSAVARTMARRWVFLLTIHYYYFTRKTISAALRRVGCDVLRVKPHIQRLEFDYVLHRAEPYVGLPARILRTLGRVTRVGRAQIPYWMGQTLVVARKTTA